ncbi:hypothetical protein C0J52_10807 [Blattella germanica]|nr:hypothetical protein C0J52_10807 [Blattella germanica]
MTALQGKSLALTASEIIQILEDLIEENVRICNSGSDLESDCDVSDDFQGDNHLISSENEEEITSQDEDVSAQNDIGQRVKHAQFVSDWEWTKIDDNNYFAQKIQFSGTTSNTISH